MKISHLIRSIFPLRGLRAGLTAVILLYGAGGGAVAQEHSGAAYYANAIQQLERGKEQLRAHIKQQQQLIGEYRNAMEGTPLQGALSRKSGNDERKQRNAERERGIRVAQGKIEGWEGQVSDNDAEIQRLNDQRRRAEREEERRRQEQQGESNELEEIRARQSQRRQADASQRADGSRGAGDLNLLNQMRQLQDQAAEAEAARRRHHEEMQRHAEQQRIQRQQSWERTQEAIRESQSRAGGFRPGIAR